MMEAVPPVMRFLRTEMRSGRSPGLSVPHFRALVYLGRHPGTTLSEVAEHMGQTRPSMSRAIDRLVRQGLVTRDSDPGDRRRVSLGLTTKGRAVLRAARQRAQTRLAAKLSGLQPARLAAVAEGMQALIELFTSGAVTAGEEVG